MHIVISSGHGLKVRGAAGPQPWGLDEVDEARKVVNRVAELLRGSDVGVTPYHDDISTSQNENLNRIVDFHNSKTRDLDVSVHFNAYSPTTSKKMGVEVLYVTQAGIAGETSAAIAEAAGLPDRGGKKRTDLFFLNNTSEPAILIETLFCDAKPDCDSYRQNFEAICRAIAEHISGTEIGGESPMPEPVPGEVARPVLGDGDVGSQVVVLQQSLGLPGDGIFTMQTEQAVEDFQNIHGLDADGICGSQTWGALNSISPLPPYPPPMPQPFDQALLDSICATAMASPIAAYSWKDRGRAPAGYIKGMAVAFAYAYDRLMADDWIVEDMAQAETGDDATDALALYDAQFRALGMDNSEDGADTLRHLFVMLLGLGMRESSGVHCEGRDMSASNVEAETCEAGLFQTSWNASACSTDFEVLFDQFESEPQQCALRIFEEGVECSSSDWDSYGSGMGREYQDLAKHCPNFAVMTTALGLRRIRQHWGPIGRFEVELKTDADRMFQAVQGLIDSLAPPEPGPPVEVATVIVTAQGPVSIKKTGSVRVIVNGVEVA